MIDSYKMLVNSVTVLHNISGTETRCSKEKATRQEKEGWWWCLYVQYGQVSVYNIIQYNNYVQYGQVSVYTV